VCQEQGQGGQRSLSHSRAETSRSTPRLSAVRSARYGMQIHEGIEDDDFEEDPRVAEDRALRAQLEQISGSPQKRSPYVPRVRGGSYNPSYNPRALNPWLNNPSTIALRHPANLQYHRSGAHGGTPELARSIDRLVSMGLAEAFSVDEVQSVML